MGGIPNIQHYVHCNGMQLRLSDSNIGPEHYSSSYYYEWPARTEPRQLLFTFPTRVNLTTITLHYYSDSQRGLPRLRFTAVPDNFDVWDATTSSHEYVQVDSVPPGGESTGHNNVNLCMHFTTTKLLMIMVGRNFNFAVSEVQFFTFSARMYIIATTYTCTT